MKYWIITDSEDAIGPYSDYDSAITFAETVFGYDGLWTITRTDDELETVES